VYGPLKRRRKGEGGKGNGVESVRKGGTEWSKCRALKKGRARKGAGSEKKKWEGVSKNIAGRFCVGGRLGGGQTNGKKGLPREIKGMAHARISEEST